MFKRFSVTSIYRQLQNQGFRKAYEVKDEETLLQKLRSEIEATKLPGWDYITEYYIRIIPRGEGVEPQCEAYVRPEEIVWGIRRRKP